MSAPLPLENQLCFSLYATSLAVTRAYKATLDKLNLTYPQYLVLHALWEKNGRTIGAIAERLSLESSTVTPLVKRLEHSGFVERRRNPDDERQVQVSLTADGWAIREACGCLGEALVARSGMSLEALSALQGQVEHLRSALSQPKEPA